MLTDVHSFTTILLTRFFLNLRGAVECEGDVDSQLMSDLRFSIQTEFGGSVAAFSDAAYNPPGEGVSEYASSGSGLTGDDSS